MMRNSWRWPMCLAFAALAVSLPLNATAEVWLEVSDGNKTHPFPAVNGFTTKAPIQWSGVMGVISFFDPTVCSPNNRPCRFYFPSGKPGSQTPLATDTFEFRDACDQGVCPNTPVTPTSSKVARVVLTEGGVQKIELKGLQVIALHPGQEHKVTVRFWNDPGDFMKSPAAEYPWGTLLGTKFARQRTGTQDLTKSCPHPTINNGHPGSKDPCSRLRLWINGQDADSQAQPPRPVAFKTVTIPCGPWFTYACKPIDYYRTNGTFKVSASGKITWNSAVDPVQKAELTDVYFKNTGETHSAINSVIAARSTRPVQNLGVEALFYSLAAEFEHPFWVYFSAYSPTFYPSKAAIPLFSIMRDKGLPEAQQAQLIRSYASFISQPPASPDSESSAKPLLWRNVNLIRLNYAFHSKEGVTPLGQKLTLSDCKNGSFRLNVALVTADNRDAIELRIYLGSDADPRTGCAGTNLKDNLVQDKALRVEAKSLMEGLKDVCCMTVKRSQDEYPDLYVRSISVVLDQGDKEPVGDQMVTLYDATIDGTRLTASVRDAASDKLAVLPEAIAPMAKLTTIVLR